MSPNPGLVELLDPGSFSLVPEMPEFEAAEQEAAAELAAVDAFLAGQLGQLSGAVGADPSAGLSEALRALDAELASIPPDDLVERHPDIDGGTVEVEDHLLAAFGAIPGEAWSPVPQPIAPPEEEPGFIPIEDDQPVQELTPAAASIVASVALYNLDRAGGTDFQVGERFQIAIDGPPGGTVSCSAMINGIDLGVNSYGVTDQNGRFFLEGVMGGTDVGYWVEVWRVGNATCSPILNFRVRRRGESGAPPAPPSNPIPGAPAPPAGNPKPTTTPTPVEPPIITYRPPDPPTATMTVSVGGLIEWRGKNVTAVQLAVYIDRRQWFEQNFGPEGSYQMGGVNAGILYQFVLFDYTTFVRGKILATVERIWRAEELPALPPYGYLQVENDGTIIWWTSGMADAWVEFRFGALSPWEVGRGLAGRTQVDLRRVGWRCLDWWLYGIDKAGGRHTLEHIHMRGGVFGFLAGTVPPEDADPAEYL